MSAAMSIDDKIRDFEDHFLNELAMVSSVDFRHNNGHGRNGVFKRLLFCCLLDTMSDVIDPAECADAPSNERQQDKWKLLVAIKRYGNWPNHDKVSLPRLSRLLERTTDPNFDSLRNCANHILKTTPWPEGGLIPISNDPSLSWLEAIWPRSAEGKPLKINQCDYNDLRHDRILYSFRNKLVHETRQVIPEGPDTAPEPGPFYHRRRTVADPVKELWILKHPSKFIEELTMNVLRGLVADHRQRQIDPGERLWTDQLWND